MTLVAFAALMATLECHTITVDVPAERQTLAYTVCVKIDVSPMKETVLEEKAEPVTPPVMKRKAGVHCKRRYFWKHHHRYWRCVR